MTVLSNVINFICLNRPNSSMHLYLYYKIAKCFTVLCIFFLSLLMFHSKYKISLHPGKKSVMHWSDDSRFISLLHCHFYIYMNNVKELLSWPRH